MPIPPQELSYEDFPASDLTCEGMEALAADRTPRLCKVTMGVEYARPMGYPLHLTIVQPPAWEGLAPLPLVLFVQGSAWHKQQLGNSLPGLMRFAARGFVVAIVEYRPSEVSPFPAHILDTKAAVRAMRRLAPKYGADPDRVAIWGDSSGGHTALMCCATMDDPALSGTSPAEQPLRLRACVDYYGPADLSRMNDVPSTMCHLSAQSPEGALLGGKGIEENPGEAAYASPVSHIKREKPLPPTLIVHGDKDRLVPFQQSVLLYETLKREGKQARLVKLLGADHGGDAFFTDGVLDIVEGFLREHL